MIDLLLRPSVASCGVPMDDIYYRFESIIAQFIRAIQSLVRIRDAKTMADENDDITIITVRSLTERCGCKWRTRK